MATETTYNVIKVQELRAISSATGSDEIIINDVDSTPLETKKITVENFAYAIKDYVLPIASAEILGGIRVGQGLTINPANGTLRNDIYYINDLNDVQVTNSKPNQVLTFDGVKWANKEFQGITEVIAGDALSGGGDNGSIILNVNAGNGLRIENDRLNVNTGLGLTTSLDVVYLDINSSLTFVGNKLSVNIGTALVLDDHGVSVNYGRGFRLYGPYLEPYLADGLEFANGDQIQAAIGAGLDFDMGHIVVSLDEGLKFYDGKVKADLGEGMEFDVNGAIDVKGKGDLTIRFGGSDLGSFNANQVGDSLVDIPIPGDGTLQIKQGNNTLGLFTANSFTNEVVNIPTPGNGRVTINQAGKRMGSFTLNQSGDVTINLTDNDTKPGGGSGGGSGSTTYLGVGSYTIWKGLAHPGSEVGYPSPGPGRWRSMGIWRENQTQSGGGQFYSLLVRFA